MNKRVAIVQSNYIPWKGYFDLIASVDEFVLFDDAQYTRRDWRNRNRIKTRDGIIWLTIPVEVAGKYLQRIRDTRVSDPGWRDKHWRSIAHNYARAPFFRDYGPALQRLYEAADQPLLSGVNRHLLQGLCDLLGIKTRLSWSSDYELLEGKTERLVHLCRQLGGDTYLSGPSARGYLDESLFAGAGIDVQWMSYDGYPEYPQAFPPFAHDVSVVDLLLNTGSRAREHLVRQPVERETASRAQPVRPPALREGEAQEAP